MSRPLKQSFNCEPLAELTRQLLFAPPAKRIAQVRRAERLHDELVAEQTYPLDFIVYRLTGYRRDRADALLLVGEAVRPDLRLMIDRLSRSVDMPLSDGETAETAAELAARLNVSVKTVTRWRKLGLRWRWAVRGEGERRQVVFPRDAVERFTQHHQARVERAAQFTKIGTAQRRELIERARRIAAGRDVSLNRVAHHLARKTGRALETVRLILEKHDRDHPERAIFVDRDGPLTPRQKRVIERAHRMGVSAGKIAARFGRTRATVYRVVHERRAAAARRVALGYVPSPTFNRDDADAVILRDGVDGDTAERKVRWSTVPLADLPEPLQALYRQPVLDAARQRSLFIRYNYLKHKAAKIREGFDRYEPRAADLDAFDVCVKRAAALRSELVRTSLPVVLSVARRHLIGQPEDSPQTLTDLLEAGQAVLLEAVESFNASRSGTFTSYLTNKLLQHFASDRGDASRSQARRRSSGDEVLERMMDQARAAGVELRQVT